MKKHFDFRSIPFGTWLLILSALVNLPRWVGMYAFDVPPVIDYISGTATGLSMAGGIAFVFHRIGKMQPLTPKGKPVVRFWLSLLGGVIILGLSVYLLPPYMVATMPEQLRASLPNPWVWSAVAVLAGDLLVMAIATVDSKAAGFTSASDAGQASKPQKPAQQTGTSRKSKGKATAQQTSRARTMAEQIECKGHCGESGTRAAMNAHSRFCTKNPANQFEQAAQQSR